jgi:predicted cupin superfamily sugar epimerase
MNAQEIIDLLGLVPHPEEGGFFREIYRSASGFEPGDPFRGDRSVGTAIYYLLTPDTYSEMHRLPGDEIFHFYTGDPVEMLLLFTDGTSDLTVLSNDLRIGRPQVVVPGSVWQGSRLRPGGEYALLGTTMSPGFEFADYERGTDKLLTAYPDRRQALTELLADARAS